MSELKVCPGYGADLPHKLPKTTDFFRFSSDGRTPKSPYCRTHEQTGHRAGNVPRIEEDRGIYLGALLLNSGSWLIKIGKSGDKASGFDSKAGRLASDARHHHDLDVVHAEIFYVIDEADPETRTTLERLLLNLAEPVHGTEYFAGSDFKLFEEVFAEYGRLYTERTTFAARWAAFNAWDAA